MSILPEGDDIVAAIATPLSMMAGTASPPTLIRLTRETGDGVERWKVANIFARTRGQLPPPVELISQMMCLLLERNQSTFYRVWLWGHHDVEIWSYDGSPQRSFPVPTRRARQVANLDLSDSSNDVAAGLVLRDAVSDVNGGLHLLTPPDNGHELHTIVVLDQDGRQVRIYTLDMAVGCLAIDKSGSYVGVAEETGELVRFQVP
ncbi:MAG TPA: hypothetical protein VFT13_03100 [Candidatus Krumholzibacteria bacterium]|nr:hypothetical protein [Candidatus Krumholzibacteria bacterium]